MLRCRWGDQIVQSNRLPQGLRRYVPAMRTLVRDVRVTCGEAIETKYFCNNSCPNSCTATNDETDMELVAAVSFVAEWPQKPEFWIDGPVQRPWRWPRSAITGNRALTCHLASLAERLPRSIPPPKQSPPLCPHPGHSSSNPT